MTPDQDRPALELRIAELTARMKALDHLRKPENVAEWAALYELREAVLGALADMATLDSPGRASRSHQLRARRIVAFIARLSETQARSATPLLAGCASCKRVLPYAAGQIDCPGELAK